MQFVAGNEICPSLILQIFVQVFQVLPESGKACCPIHGFPTAPGKCLASHQHGQNLNEFTAIRFANSFAHLFAQVMSGDFCPCPWPTFVLTTNRNHAETILVPKPLPTQPKHCTQWSKKTTITLSKQLIEKYVPNT